MELTKVWNGHSFQWDIMFWFHVLICFVCSISNERYTTFDMYQAWAMNQPHPKPFLEKTHEKWSYSSWIDGSRKAAFHHVHPDLGISHDMNVLFPLVGWWIEGLESGRRNPFNNRFVRWYMVYQTGIPKQYYHIFKTGRNIWYTSSRPVVVSKFSLRRGLWDTSSPWIRDMPGSQRGHRYDVGETAMGACLKHVIFGVLIHVIYPYLSNELLSLSHSFPGKNMFECFNSVQLLIMFSHQSSCLNGVFIFQNGDVWTQGEKRHITNN